MLKFKRRLQRKEVLMIASIATRYLAAFESVFDLGDQVWAPAIAQTETQPPNLLGKNSPEHIVVHVAQAADHVALVGEDLAEAYGGVKFACEVVDAFHRIVIHVAPV